MKVSRWLAPLMSVANADTIWCPSHLEPYRARWPLGAPTACVYLTEAAAEKTSLADGPELFTELAKRSPLCCWVDPSTLKAIYRKTVPRD